MTVTCLPSQGFSPSFPPWKVARPLPVAEVEGIRMPPQAPPQSTRSLSARREKLFKTDKRWTELPITCRCRKSCKMFKRVEMAFRAQCQSCIVHEVAKIGDFSCGGLAHMLRSFRGDSILVGGGRRQALVRHDAPYGDCGSFACPPPHFLAPLSCSHWFLLK